MKNKIKITLLFFCIFFNLINLSYSNEYFKFNITEIEIKNNGNKFIGKNKGTAISSNGITIDAINFEYNKITNILISSGNVRIFDPKNNVTIYSDNVTYFKNDEVIFADGNSRAIDDEIQIDAQKFEYNKLENVILANGKVKINNKKDKYLIYSDNVTYNKKIKKVFTKNNSKAISEDTLVTADILSYDQDQNILEAKGKVKIEDKVEKYILEAEYINYNRNSEKIFTKNKTKILIDSKYEFNSKDVFLNKKLKELKSDNTSTVRDNNLNF